MKGDFRSIKTSSHVKTAEGTADDKAADGVYIKIDEDQVDNNGRK